MLPSKATPLSLQTAEQAAQKDIIPGFVLAEQPLTPKAFPPPRIPKDYHPRHVFAEDLVVPGERPIHPTQLMLRALKCVSPDGARQEMPVHNAMSPYTCYEQRCPSS